MQRLPGDYSVLNNRQERPAPNDSVEGDEIVRSIRKRVGTVNPLVPGSSPGGPTTFFEIQTGAGLIQLLAHAADMVGPALETEG